MSQVEPGSATSSRLRILLVIKCLGFGGAERLLVDMVARGDTQSFHYEVAYVLAAEHALVPDIVSTGTPVHGLDGRGNGDLRWMGRLRRLIVDGRFDVVHFHLPYTAAVGRLVVASIPSGRSPAIVYTEHSLWNKMAVLVRGLNRPPIGLRPSFGRGVRGRLDALRPGPPSNAPGSSCTGWTSPRPDALVADGSNSRGGPSRARRARGRPLARHGGQLRPEKGYDVLLAAARPGGRPRTAVTDAPPWARAPGGRSGSAPPARLGARLQFLGQRHDVLRLLTAADMFVLASRQEGLPVSLMEATSIGVAIVATSVGGVPQVITDGIDGLVVPPGNPAALVAALERLVDDSDLRSKLGQAAKLRSTIFDVTSASREVEGIYRDVAGGGR